MLTERPRSASPTSSRFGVEFDRENGRFSLGREGAHRRNRILHAGGDATGFGSRSRSAGRCGRPNVDIRERHFLTDLLVEGGRARGVSVLDPAGRRREFEGRQIVLATGGAGQLYRYTTNPEVATGDGLAAAFRAGAAVADLEFYQFHPTALALAGAPPFLISEAVRGEGGILRDAERPRLHARLRPPGRARVPRRRRSGDRPASCGGALVYLDVTHLAADARQRSASRRSPPSSPSVGIDLTERADPGRAGCALPDGRRS